MKYFEPVQAISIFSCISISKLVLENQVWKSEFSFPNRMDLENEFDILWNDETYAKF